MRFYFCLLLSLMVSFSLLAQDGSYRIDTVDYDISGRTKPHAIERYFGYMDGKTFASREELVQFLIDYEQSMEKSHIFQLATVSYQPTSATNFNVTITIVDSFTILPIVAPFYTSSVGFALASVIFLNNTGGNLFDTTFIGTAIFPSRNNEIAWDDPSWNGALNFKNIKAGPIIFAVGAAYNNNVVFIQDRGEEIFSYESQSVSAHLDLEYRFDKNWKLLANSTYEYAILTNVRKNVDNYGALIGGPYSFKTSAYLGALYDNASLLASRQQGEKARLSGKYTTFYSLNDHQTHHEFEAEAKFGQFWTVSSFYHPSLTFVAFGKSGLPDFTLGRFTSGIRDGELRGNFGLFLDTTHLFRLLVIKSKKNEEVNTFEMQLGPILSYAAVFEPDRAFDAQVDQGVAVGLKTALFFSAFPSMPLELSLAYDLRKGAKNRMEIAFSSSFVF